LVGWVRIVGNRYTARIRPSICGKYKDQLGVSWKKGEARSGPVRQALWKKDNREVWGKGGEGKRDESERNLKKSINLLIVVHGRGVKRGEKESLCSGTGSLLRLVGKTGQGGSASDGLEPAGCQKRSNAGIRSNQRALEGRSQS